MRQIITLTLMALPVLIAGCFGGGGGESINNVGGDESAGDDSPSQNKGKSPIMLFNQTILVGPGVDVQNSWEFTLEQGYESITLTMDELEGVTVGDYYLSVTDPLGNETVLLDSLGVRLGTRNIGLGAGSVQNGANWSNPIPGEWQIKAQSTGIYQQKITIIAE